MYASGFSRLVDTSNHYFQRLQEQKVVLGIGKSLSGYNLADVHFPIVRESFTGLSKFGDSILEAYSNTGIRSGSTPMDDCRCQQVLGRNMYISEPARSMTKALSCG